MQTDQILHRLRAALAAAVAVVALAAPATAPAAAGSKAKQDDRQYYVSLGDSYSTGYQPAPGGGLGSSTKDGYAYVLRKLAKKRGYDLKLVNFGRGRRELHQEASPLRRPDHRLDRRQRRDRVRRRERPVRVRVRRRAANQDQPRDVGTAPARRRRLQGQDRRPHLPRRDPRTLGERKPGRPQPRRGLRRRVPRSHKPGPKGQLRVCEG